MRIAFLVNRDIESNLALNLVLPELRERIAAVFLSDRVGGGRRNAAPMLGQLAHVEQDLFNEWVFPLVENGGNVDGRFATFSELEIRHGIPVRRLEPGPSALEQLRAAGADLFISIRFGRILGSEAIGLPRLGVLNLHSGLLPQYRGVLATFHALLNGDSEIGCTLHWIDSPGIDEGPIISTARVGVRRDRSLLWHILALYPACAALLLEAIRRLQAELPIEARTQATGEGAYYTFPTEQELIRFTTQGWRLFDREDIREVANRYRA